MADGADGIRAAAAADDEAVVALWHGCGPVQGGNDPRADVHLALGGPGSTVLLGLKGEQSSAA